jgi:hypothetical protein
LRSLGSLPRHCWRSARVMSTRRVVGRGSVWRCWRRPGSWSSPGGDCGRARRWTTPCVRAWVPGGAPPSTPGWPPSCTAACHGPEFCSGHFPSVVAMSSGWRISATAARGNEICSMSTVIAPIRRAVPRWCTCTEVGSGAAGSRARRFLSCTGWRARVGCASARTIAWVRLCGFLSTRSTPRGCSPGCGNTATSTAPTRRWCSSRVAPRAVTWPRWLPSPLTTPGSSPGSRVPTPRSPPPSACTATTAASMPTSGHPPHPRPTSEGMRHRSLWRTAIGTRWCWWRTPDPSSSGCGAARRTRLSTRSCPGRSTPSTCSIPSALRQSSMRSRAYRLGTIARAGIAGVARPAVVLLVRRGGARGPFLGCSA